MTYEAHPAADLFPLISADELRALGDDIAANGLRHPIVLDDRGRVLDGRNRLRACELVGVEPRFVRVDVSDPIAFVLTENLHRRHLTPGQRAALALNIEAMYAADAKSRQGARTDLKPTDFETDLSQSPADRKSAAKAAKAAKTSSGSVKKAKKLKRDAPDLFAAVESGAQTLDRAARQLRDREAEQRRVDQARAHAATLPIPLTIDLRLGDFREVLADVTGVDAIITDPPYPAEYLPLLADLAAFADKALKPDGVLVVLMGQTHLPEVYRLLDGHRPYRWTCAYLTFGANYVAHHRRVESRWKPLLVYGDGPRTKDVFRSDDVGRAAKDQHHWGQDYDAFRDLVETFTSPGQTVCDPFAGSGTTLLAAKALGRHAIGAELDPQHHATAAGRLA